MLLIVICSKFGLSAAEICTAIEMTAFQMFAFRAT